MVNNSATGGYLAPAVAPAPLEGLQLQDFIQEVLAGVTGLDGKLVRPTWLSEPANIPTAGTCWCAFSIGTRKGDTFPQVEHVTNGNYPSGADQLQRQEELPVVASFYDLGSSGLADYYAAVLRDGLVIAQNREVLLANSFDLAYTGDITPAPVVLKERWQYRVDLEIVFRRQVDRSYPVLNLRSFEGQVVATSGGSGVPIGSFVIGGSPVGGEAVLELTVDMEVNAQPPIP